MTASKITLQTAKAEIAVKKYCMQCKERYLTKNLCKKRDFKSAEESFVFANQSTSYQSLEDYLGLEV